LVTGPIVTLLMHHALVCHSVLIQLLVQAYVLKPSPLGNCVSSSTLTAVRRSQLLARWPGTHSQILSGLQRAAQTVLGIYLKHTCSRDTSASSALGVLIDYVLYKSTHSLHFHCYSSCPSSCVCINACVPDASILSPACYWQVLVDHVPMSSSHFYYFKSCLSMKKDTL